VTTSRAPHEPADDQEFARELYRLSNEAFSLTQQLIDGAQDAPALESRARALNERLSELWPRTEAAAARDPGLSRAWSDARVDVGYVLSGGDTPTTTTRVMQYLQTARNKSPG